MTKTNTKSDLTELLNHSQAAKMLIGLYQKALAEVARSTDLAKKRALITILNQENIHDPQSIQFTEITLENFVEMKLLVKADQEILRQQFAIKAEGLLRSFLFFNSAEKDQYLQSIKNVTLKGQKELIQLLREGHHKQDNYLRTFAQKDPKTAIKFEILAAGQGNKSSK